MKPKHAFHLAATALSAALGAQTTYIAPAGTQTVEGNSNNTIPWWTTSATYQQVHDSADLLFVFPAPVAIIKGLSFRKDAGVTTIPSPRTMDVQITIGTTPVTAVAASTTFAANFGPTQLVVLPYTNVSLPMLNQVSSPNPQGWFFPFTVPFPCVLTSGNLCWEMRFKNCSTGASAPCDAVQSMAPPPTIVGALRGIGCTVTGQTAPSTIGLRSLALATGQYVNRLDRGPVSAAAAMVMGAQAQTLTLPGLCGALETVPLISFPGTTDAAGSWTNSLTFGSLVNLPPATIYAQFAFADAGLQYGFGLSDCSPITIAPPGLGGIARIWYGSGAVQGNENALTGSRETYPYGLVTGFDT
jgi:hypothetical protein